MSCLVLFWLLLLLELVKDTGRFNGSLTLLKKAMSQRVSVGTICLFPQRFTDVPWAAPERLVCSSLALWANPSFDGDSHCQGS